jgi:glycosyltransferase involved in cell wall biosynthesis
MQDHLFFSIIIPTYNRASFIDTTIRSVLAQTYRNFEIIIVDDGSTDNTEEIIKNIDNKKIRYFKIQNSERGFARNYGTARANGDYITFLDSDDILLPMYFANACESITKYNNPPFLHLGYEIVNPDNSVLVKISELRNDDIQFLIYGNSLSCMGCFLRADVSKLYKFNEDRELSGSEDWELWFRVLANFGIKTDNRISARMYNHDTRSVTFQMQEKSLIRRKDLSLKYAFMDENVKKKYLPYFKTIDAFGDSYIALHMALSGNIRSGIHYLKRFIMNYPQGIFSIRFFAILKCLLLNLNSKK